MLLLTLVHYPLSIFYLSREKLRANFAGLSLFIKLIAGIFDVALLSICLYGLNVFFRHIHPSLNKDEPCVFGALPVLLAF
jgi:hypothetical protein